MIRFNPNTFSFPAEHKLTKCDRKNMRKYGIKQASDVIMSFDIETSRAWLDGDNLIPYNKQPENWFKGRTPVSICYIWQLNIDGTVYYGRTLEEFRTMLSMFPQDAIYFIYVHNLAYEFQFLMNVLDLKAAFAREPHSPITAMFQGYNIEFRCSYQLTHLSLENWGKVLKLPKMVGDLDYDIIRTPLTDMTQKELGYCERDVEVVYKGIEAKLKQYEHIINIPITQTGEVRQVIKPIIQADAEAHAKMIEATPKTASMYHVMRLCFAGGYTHANVIFADQTIRQAGESYDFASSYPAQMLSKKYPYASSFQPDRFDPKKTEEYGYMLKVEFKNLTAVTNNHYLTGDIKRLIKKDGIQYDNGRIVYAKDIILWMTEQDLDIVQKTYKYKSMDILMCYSAKKEYLPKCFVEYIFKLYENKTSLKNVQGYEFLYTQSKQFLNSLYGMSVTALIQDECFCDGIGQWNREVKTAQDITAYLNECHDPKNMKRIFLAYPIGVWITAYARHALWDNIIPYDDKVIYCDTDSIKLIGHADFSAYNAKITQQIYDLCDFYGLDRTLAAPLDPKGKAHPLGVFEHEIEHDFTEFRTLGAKRYVFRDLNGELQLTVAGINKGAVAVLKNDIDNFNRTLVFDKDDPSVHKMLVTYTAAQPTVTWNKGQYDEYNSEHVFGIILRPTGYKMSITEEYSDLIEQARPYSLIADYGA